MPRLHLVQGVAAGLVASLALSGALLAQQAVGLLPELNPIMMLAGMAGARTPLAGWVLHGLIGGVLWGGLYAALAPRLPGPAAVKGMLFALGPWAFVVAVAMPVAGLGLFGLRLGAGAALLTLAMHLLFGAVLGAVHALLAGRRERRG